MVRMYMTYTVTLIKKHIYWQRYVSLTEHKNHKSSNTYDYTINVSWITEKHDKHPLQ